MSRLCTACQRRAYTAYQCCRITELIAAMRVPVELLDEQLEELVALQAEAAETHPIREDWIN